jgi:hypothetical protein
MMEEDRGQNFEEAGFGQVVGERMDFDLGMAGIVTPVAVGAEEVEAGEMLG